MKTSHRTAIEPLEPRIAPAAFVTYLDADGDLVKISASAGPLDITDLALPSGDPAIASPLYKLTLSETGFAGANITFTVTKKPGGDGFADVGFIDAGTHDLGNVTVKGDLGQIHAGNGNDLDGPALKTLSVRTLGRYGLASQGGGGDLLSEIAGTVVALKVTGDLVGAYFYLPAGDIGSVKIGGSLVGGDIPGGGAIYAGGVLGPVVVKGDVLGATGNSSGSLGAGHAVKGVTIGGSIFGGSGVDSGLIFSGFAMMGDADIGPVKIGRDLRGGSGTRSGSIDSAMGLTSVTLGGSLVGGTATKAGIIDAIFMGPVKIGSDVQGGTALSTGTIFSHTLASLTIGGSLVGGAANGSGVIFSIAEMGFVKIGRDLRGGVDPFSGEIQCITKLAGVSIGGSFVHSDIRATTEITGTVKIGGDLFSSTIQSDGRIGGVSIGGSLVGGASSQRGVILAGGDLGAVQLGGNLVGGSIRASDSLDQSGFIRSNGRIASVTIGGSIVSGIDTSTDSLTNNATIRAANDIGAITVKGSLIGNTGDGTPGNFSPVIISARGEQALAPGATIDIAIKSLSVGGRVEHARILAGYTYSLSPVNGNASIGAVKVGGDWIASILVAGIADGGAPGFGTAGDTVIATPPADAIIARIASITIKGVVLGSSAGGDHFGFTAQQIGSFKAGLYTAPLTPATDPLILLAPLTDDVTIREV